MLTRTFVVAMSLAAAACGGDDAPIEAVRFPADYAATYQEVRSCRYSLDHGMEPIRIVMTPEHAAAYLARTSAFVPGTIIVKEQFDGADTDCAGPIVSHTVMERLERGSSPETLDWAWQEVEDRRVVTEDVLRCVQCHSGCTADNMGFENTCAMED